MTFERGRVFKFLRHRLAGKGIDDADIARMIEESIVVAPALGIEDDSDLIRFVELQTRFSKAQLDTPHISNALTKTLARSKWTMSQRLDFVDRQLVGRAPSAEPIERKKKRRNPRPAPTPSAATFVPKPEAAPGPTTVQLIMPSPMGFPAAAGPAPDQPAADSTAPGMAAPLRAPGPAASSPPPAAEHTIPMTEAEVRRLKAALNTPRSAQTPPPAAPQEERTEILEVRDAGRDEASAPESTDTDNGEEATEVLSLRELQDLIRGA